MGNVSFEEFIDDNSFPSGPALWGNAIDRYRRSFICGLATQTEETFQELCSTSAGTGSIFTYDLDDIQNKVKIKFDMSKQNNKYSQILNSCSAAMECPIDSSSGFHEDSGTIQEHNEDKVPQPHPAPPFVKITLHETDDIVLFERNSTTVPHDSDEASHVNADNDGLNNGPKRRTKESETQTNIVLYKSRTVNTDLVNKSCVGTFVSNYDMFDTYADLARNTQSLDSLDKRAKIEITTYSLSGVLDDPDEKLA